MTIANKPEAEGFMLCKICIYCRGTGTLGVSTAQNPSQYSGNGNAMPCPSCVRGFIFISLTESEMSAWLKDQLKLILPTLGSQLASLLFPELVTQLQNGPLRSKFFDSLVAEVEQRIKDVELKILDAPPEKTKSVRAWKVGERCFVSNTLGNPGKIPGVIKSVPIGDVEIPKLTISLNDGSTAYKDPDSSDVEPVEKDNVPF
jgi:hypothetical protein